MQKEVHRKEEEEEIYYPRNRSSGVEGIPH